MTYNEALKANNERLAAVRDKIAAGGSPAPILLQSKTVTPTKSVQEVTPDAAYDGLEKVTVNAIPSEYVVPSGSQELTENGSYDVTNIKTVTVNVASSGGGGSESGEFDVRVSFYGIAYGESGAYHEPRARSGFYRINGGAEHYFGETSTLTVIDAVDAGGTVTVYIVGAYYPYAENAENCSVDISTEYGEIEEGMEVELTVITISGITGNASLDIKDSE